jgi:hypothetical protein
MGGSVVMGGSKEIRRVNSRESNCDDDRASVMSFSECSSAELSIDTLTWH